MPYYQHSTDQELREGCVLNDRLAQAYLYRRFFGRLMGVAMRYAGDREAATEVLNTAFFKIFNSLGQYNDTGSFLSWMISIVVHTAIDQQRKSTTYRRHLERIIDDSPAVEYDCLIQLEVDDLLRLIQQLPPATRMVFSLFVIDGYKHREIAEMLGIDEGTSKWHLSAARKELQQLVKKYYQTSP